MYDEATTKGLLVECLRTSVGTGDAAADRVHRRAVAVLWLESIGSGGRSG
jgi:hypothetical protein